MENLHSIPSTFATALGSPTASPAFPARAVRPTRWMYLEEATWFGHKKGRNMLVIFGNIYLILVRHVFHYYPTINQFRQTLQHIYMYIYCRCINMGWDFQSIHTQDMRPWNQERLDITPLSAMMGCWALGSQLSIASSNNVDPKTSIWTLDSKKYSKCWKKGRSKHCELKYARLDGSRVLGIEYIYIYKYIYKILLDTPMQYK